MILSWYCTLFGSRLNYHICQLIIQLKRNVTNIVIVICNFKLKKNIEFNNCLISFENIDEKLVP